jgi:hypothetical protein
MRFKHIFPFTLVLLLAMVVAAYGGAYGYGTSGTTHAPTTSNPNTNVVIKTSTTPDL